MATKAVYGVSFSDLVIGNFDLSHSQCNNVTLYPKRNAPNIGRGTALGLINAQGAFVPDSAVCRMTGSVTEEPDPLPAQQVEYRNIDAIYGGCMVRHYGHFLLESLSRLWYAAQNDLPIVWASGIELDDMQCAVLKRLKIAPERSIFVDRPTRFRSLIVPRPGYIIQNGFHPDHARFLSCIGAEVRHDRRVYLSRGAFRSHIATVKNEEIVEKILRQHGWDIVYPERLHVNEQLRLFASSACIAGIEGSAFHTAILCERMAGSLTMVRRNKPNLNYDTIAKVKLLTQHNIVGRIDVAPEDNDPKSLWIAHPEAVAQEIIHTFAA